MNGRGILVLALLAGAVGGCGGASGQSSIRAEIERMRIGPAAKEAAELAPQAFAHAEEERSLAAKAIADKDDAAAAAHGERAVAAYTHAFVLARLARATSELSDATAARARAVDEARQLTASRSAAEREGTELDKQLKVAQAALLPPSSSAADPQREAARLVAARSLWAEARLLCGAARLVSANAPGLADAEGSVADLGKRLANAKEGSTGKTLSPIDAAARARAGCLGVLTKARRGTPDGAPGHADTLLAELSASSGWDPQRDERGVVVAVNDAFTPAGAPANGKNASPLKADVEAKLKELGRVARAHPTFAVQIVVHDATRPKGADPTAPSAGASARGEAVKKALVDGGADAAKTTIELAGASAPRVDPEDAAHRARNERVEIVFVSPQN
jgi:outer membrane protein OmpA-like peptidoglycan-associated protein